MVHVQVKHLPNNTNIKFIMLAQSVIAVIFLGVLEKEWLGMWGHGMAEVHGWLEESRRHECGHVDVIVALIRFTAPMLHTKVSECYRGLRCPV